MWAQRRRRRRVNGFGYECSILDAVGIICGKESILIGFSIFQGTEGISATILVVTDFVCVLSLFDCIIYV